jgi:hypothetical protein
MLLQSGAGWPSIQRPTLLWTDLIHPGWYHGVYARRFFRWRIGIWHLTDMIGRNRAIRVGSVIWLVIPLLFWKGLPSHDFTG